MSDPPSFKRIGEIADEILNKLEKIHGAEDEQRTEKDDAAQPAGGDGADRIDPVQQR